MRRRPYPLIASLTLILAILACNMPGGQQATGQPNLAGTITAQAETLQAPSDTPAPGETPQPTNTPFPTQPPQQQQPPAPQAPSKPKNFKTNGSATAISFSWNDNSLNESGFRIYQEGQSAPIATVNGHDATGGMSYNYTGLSCGFKGKFSVRAYNDQGESDSSNQEDGVTVPCQPTNLTALGQGNDIHFNWAVANPHNEDGFRIYQDGVSSSVASRGPNKGSGGTNYDMNGLLCNIVATYSVTAYNSAGESPASNKVQAETVPCGPSNFTITGATKDTVTYTWMDNATNETGFHVYVDDVLYATLSGSSPFEHTGVLGNDAFQLCGQTHVYAIRAFNYAGESTWSEHSGATTSSC